MLEEYAKLHTLQKDTEARLKTLKTELAPILQDGGPVTHNGVYFSAATVAGRTSYDTALMLADGVDLSKYTKVGAPSVRVTVKAGAQA